MNYQIEMENEIKKNLGDGKNPTLLLHRCCGPCSSYVLECLSKYFKVTIIYYNPNIYPSDEYEKRLLEQRKIIDLLPVQNTVDILEVDYNHDEYLKKVTGLEEEKEDTTKLFTNGFAEATKDGLHGRAALDITNLKLIQYDKISICIR